jgi:hypothetical protein
MNIVSFLCPRRDDRRWDNRYFELLDALQWSCDRLGLRHVCLTDDPKLNDHCAAPVELFAAKAPRSLMKACNWLQHRWITQGDWLGMDTLFVGADTLMIDDPLKLFGGDYDMAVTIRFDIESRVNTGAMLVREAARPEAGALFERMVAITREVWCGDQEAVGLSLLPLPDAYGTHKRHGLRVAFLPMEGYNARPMTVDEAMPGYALLHFRGRWDRKGVMIPWAQRWLGYPA